jgi:hypothetical protein
VDLGFRVFDFFKGLCWFFFKKRFIAFGFRVFWFFLGYRVFGFRV